jgi:hypothetical protein
MNVIKIVGLPSTGTNLCRKGLIKKKTNAIVVDDILGWKHGYVLEKIIHDENLWHGEYYITNKKPKRLKKMNKELLDELGIDKEILSNITIDDMRYVVCFKNVYNWIYSINSSDYFPCEWKGIDTVEERVELWNKQNKYYMEHIINNPEKYAIFKSDNVHINRIFNRILRRITKKYELRPQVKNVNIEKRVGLEYSRNKKNKQGNDFSMYGRENIRKFLDADVIKTISQCVDKEVCDFLGYKILN